MNTLDVAGYSVIMLLTKMKVNHKQPSIVSTKEHGEFLAGWLNHFEESNAPDRLLDALGLRSKPRGFIKGFAERRRRDTESFLHRLVVLYVEGKKSLQALDSSSSPRQREWWDAFLRAVRGSHRYGTRAVRANEIHLRSLDWALRFDAVFKPLPNGRLSFELMPENDSSRVLFALAALINSGDATRIRRCRGCEQFFFAWPRRDRQECSPRCKTAYWQKTPQGKATKAAYMRDLRAKQKKLWEAKQRGRKLKRGRNVHVSFTKGE